MDWAKADYFCAMDLQNHYDVLEDALQTLNIDPETARCEGKGQWLIQRGDVELYIDIWQPQEHNQWEYFNEDDVIPIFQVVAPVCSIPDNAADLTRFMEELLYVNHHMFYGSFTVNRQEKMAAIGYKRLVEGCNRVEMIEPIEALGYYAENLGNFFAKKYGVKKFEKI